MREQLHILVCLREGILPPLVEIKETPCFSFLLQNNKLQQTVKVKTTPLYYLTVSVDQI